MANILDALTNDDGSAVDTRPPPSAKVVTWLHGQASTVRREDIHHRIGFGPGDVSDGSHDHDGKNSKTLWATGTLALLASGATLPDTVTKVNEIISLLKLKGA